MRGEENLHNDSRDDSLEQHRVRVAQRQTLDDGKRPFTDTAEWGIDLREETRIDLLVELFEHGDGLRLRDGTRIRDACDIRT